MDIVIRIRKQLKSLVSFLERAIQDLDMQVIQSPKKKLQRQSCLMIDQLLKEKAIVTAAYNAFLNGSYNHIDLQSLSNLEVKYDYIGLASSIALLKKIIRLPHECRSSHLRVSQGSCEETERSVDKNFDQEHIPEESFLVDGKNESPL